MRQGNYYTRGKGTIAIGERRYFNTSLYVFSHSVPWNPITSWQIDEETMETMRNFIFLGSKITAYGDCSHDSERSLLLGRKVMTNPDSILLPANVHLIKAMAFPVVMYGCESWTIKTLLLPMRLSRISHVQLFVAPWIACQARLCMEFARQEYLSV